MQVNKSIWQFAIIFCIGYMYCDLTHGTRCDHGEPFEELLDCDIMCFNIKVTL